MLCSSLNEDGLLTSPYGFLQFFFCQSISSRFIHFLHCFKSKIINTKKNCVEDDLSRSSSPMTTVQSTVQWLESSLQSPPGFRIPFESSQSKTSLPSSSPSAPPWPWPPCWPPCWPGGYWGRPGPGPGPHIYFIVWTFQIRRAAAGTKKGKFVCLKLLLSVELNKTSKPFVSVLLSASVERFGVSRIRDFW